MKLSLSWIFDHIKYNLKDVNVKDLVAKFSAITAEIEDVRYISVDLSSFFLATVIKIDSDSVFVECHELKKKISLPFRPNTAIGKIYLIKKEKKDFLWATTVDIGAEIQSLIPEIYVEESLISGAWKDSFESEDYIITIDNKAITNRPDMWSHRGFAREMAAILGTHLVSEDTFLSSKTIRHFSNESVIMPNNPFTLSIDTSSHSCGNPCKRIAGLYLPKVENRTSSLHMAIRLLRIDSRPLDILIDCTNYVMFDIGQPMHAFDAEKITAHKIIAKCARQGEFIELLDNTVIQLESTDIVISDGDVPIALAGIMGGQFASVSQSTNSVYLESANFDAITIRRTANRLKKRTESSTRFEKSLDPNQNTTAILRYIKLLNDLNIKFESCEVVVSVGALITEKVITVAHNLIVNKIGYKIESSKVTNILNKLGFGYQVIDQNGMISYTITVPTYRSTKDVTIPEDIVEEIARFAGYNNVVENLPIRAMKPFDIHGLMKLRQLKQHLAFGLSMAEVQTYAFYDEEFLKKIHYDPKDVLMIANPQSQNWQRLIDSLVPNLLKTVLGNSANAESLRFFEFNRVWFNANNNPQSHNSMELFEAKELAGIIYSRKTQLNFYECKSELNTTFDMLKIEVEYKKPEGNIDPWYNKNQTAQIWYNNKIIGQCGKLSAIYSKYLDNCDAFIFELDGNFVINFRPDIVKFKPMHKYQAVDLDISMLINPQVHVSTLEALIKNSHNLIRNVELVDFYESKEWDLKRSLTFRFILYDENKTLTKEEIDDVWNSVVYSLQGIGAQIR